MSDLDLFGSIDVSASVPAVGSLGHAGEYLVAADLALAGYDVSIAAPGLRYDLVVDARRGPIRGLLRVQVKSTRGLRTESRGPGSPPRVGYLFGDTHCGLGGLRSYAADADILAFAALDLRLVVYVATDRVAKRMALRPEDFSVDRALRSMEAAICDALSVKAG